MILHLFPTWLLFTETRRLCHEPFRPAVPVSLAIAGLTYTLYCSWMCHVMPHWWWVFANMVFLLEDRCTCYKQRFAYCICGSRRLLDLVYSKNYRLIPNLLKLPHMKKKFQVVLFKINVLIIKTLYCEISEELEIFLFRGKSNLIILVKYDESQTFLEFCFEKMNNYCKSKLVLPRLCI